MTCYPGKHQQEEDHHLEFHLELSKQSIILCSQNIKIIQWIITATIFISHLRKLNFRDNNNVSMILDTSVNDDTLDQQAIQSSIHQSLI